MKHFGMQFDLFSSRQWVDNSTMPMECNMVVYMYSGIGRSQTMPGHCTHLFFVVFFLVRGSGLGACFPSKFLHLRGRQLHVLRLFLRLFLKCRQS